ncbi:Regulatory protein RecX [bioreactor metagenome]|uniref:Regulatory protein RecX n=1 Tax=bioreactor metagenome TaxID=1076179 RepID=A0A645B5C3_9ZZZZ|nr:recombination regulator RecX [Clostridium sp. HMP27]KGK88326.1 recombinase RecX [Clostridium sp. HMP27]
MEHIITKIEVQKRNKNRVNVYVNEDFLFACSAEIIYNYGLKSGEKIDIDKIKAIIEEDNYIKCKNDALHSIERAYKTEKQVVQKLLAKGYEKSTIEKAILFLREYNFLDDSKFADMYVKEKLLSQGRNKIKYSLMQKGLDESLIKEKLQSIDKEKEGDSLERIGVLKYQQLIKREEDTRKIYKKLGDYLMRRGYPWDDVKSFLNRTLKEASQLD